MPRARPPDWPNCEEANTWPSTIGSASLTPGTFGDAVGDGGVIGQRRLDALQEDMAVEADDLVHQVEAKAVHHRHDDDQRRDAEHDAERTRSRR